MSEHYERHAVEVSEAFLEMVGDDVSALISKDHRNGLAMLVEAAISTAVFEELQQAADRVAALSRSIRDDAERYDKN